MSVEVGKKVDQTLTGLFSLLLVYLSITLQNKCTTVLGPLPMLTISKTKNCHCLQCPLTAEQGVLWLFHGNKIGKNIIKLS